MKRYLFLLTMVLTSTFMMAADTFVSFTPQPDAIRLSVGNISYSEQDYEAVKIAINSLKADLQRVGLKSQGTEGSILIGTIGRNSEIDQLKLEGLKGCREKFIITTIDNRVVIAGSDRRGTVFGIYELSCQLGVSPWYWWADVPVVPHEAAYIKKGVYTDGEPAVEFRGIFLNDEAPCLTSWVKNTWGTNYGDHRFYEKVFELILRLKGNMLWPAMWSWAFYSDDPENGKTADRMGVIVGTSHHEPMARNHQEYARKRKEWGPWNYQTNQKNLDKFFREGIERMKDTEDMVTIGMRGDGDEAMSEDADTKLLQRIVDNQRKIIKQVTGRPAKETTQVWALYKEVLDYYDKGMRVPDDVIMLLCDDNWGNVRRVPSTERERKHPGGWGLYYHVDYVGAPRNTKWLNVTPSQAMWEQLTLAYQYGIKRMWILNVGDLKPMEYPITLFMDMAWNPSSVSRFVEESHTLPFCRQQFGESQAKEAARILNLTCKYAGRCTAEMLDARTYNVATGEWKQVADDYMRLEAEALRQYITLKPEYRDAYQQLILFPVQAMSNLYQMYYAQAMNHYLHATAPQSPELNEWADRVEQCFRRDSLLCASYNETMAGGKWKGMMTQKHIGYTSWNDNFPKDKQPHVFRSNENTAGGYTFVGEKGQKVLSIEADHYYAATTASAQTEWTVTPDLGRTRCGLSLMPYTEPVEGAQLVYRWQLNNEKEEDTVTIHVITRSTLDFLNKGGQCFRVSVDGGEAQVLNINKDLNERPENVYAKYYPTVASRVIETVATLTYGKSQAADAHQLTIEPLYPGIVFEKIVIDTDGKAPKTHLFGNESRYTKKDSGQN